MWHEIINNVTKAQLNNKSQHKINAVRGKLGFYSLQILQFEHVWIISTHDFRQRTRISSFSSDLTCDQSDGSSQRSVHSREQQSLKGLSWLVLSCRETRAAMRNKHNMNTHAAVICVVTLTTIIQAAEVSEWLEAFRIFKSCYWSTLKDKDHHFVLKLCLCVRVNQLLRIIISWVQQPCSDGFCSVLFCWAELHTVFWTWEQLVYSLMERPLCDYLLIFIINTVSLEFFSRTRTRTTHRSSQSSIIRNSLLL